MLAEGEYPGPALPGAIFIQTIRPEVIDEWFGIVIRFEWPGAFRYRSFKIADHAFQQKWDYERPGDIWPGLPPNEKRLRDFVASCIIESGEFSAFYDKPTFVMCEEYDGGPRCRVCIPKFGALELDDWDFTEWGGWISALTRM